MASHFFPTAAKSNQKKRRPCKVCPAGFRVMHLCLRAVLIRNPFLNKTKSTNTLVDLPYQRSITRQTLKGRLINATRSNPPSLDGRELEGGALACEGDTQLIVRSTQPRSARSPCSLLSSTTLVAQICPDGKFSLD